MQIDKLFRKASSVIKRGVFFFYYDANPHNINPIYYLRMYNEGIAVSRLRKYHKELFQLISHLMALSNSTGCEFGNYYKLYQLIRRLKPTTVLECGSGISTGVIAFALAENFIETSKLSTFISAEESLKYHEQIKEIIPTRLKEWVTFVLSEREEKTYGNDVGCFYKDIPQLQYDFIFVDGPTISTLPDGRRTFNSDIINIVDFTSTQKNLFGIIDQRIETYLTLKKKLPHLRFQYNPVENMTSFTQK